MGEYAIIIKLFIGIVICSILLFISWILLLLHKNEEITGPLRKELFKGLKIQFLTVSLFQRKMYKVYNPRSMYNWMLKNRYGYDQDVSFPRSNFWQFMFEDLWKIYFFLKYRDNSRLRMRIRDNFLKDVDFQRQISLAAFLLPELTIDFLKKLFTVYEFNIISIDEDAPKDSEDHKFYMEYFMLDKFLFNFPAPRIVHLLNFWKPDFEKFIIIGLMTIPFMTTPPDGEKTAKKAATILELYGHFRKGKGGRPDWDGAYKLFCNFNRSWMMLILPKMMPFRCNMMLANEKDDDKLARLLTELELWEKGKAGVTAKEDLSPTAESLSPAVKNLLNQFSIEKAALIRKKILKNLRDEHIIIPETINYTEGQTLSEIDIKNINKDIITHLYEQNLINDLVKS